MTTFTRAVLTIGVVALAGCASMHHSARTTAYSTDDAEFKALIDGYYKAWTIAEGKGHLVPEAASRYYAKDADLVFYDFAPMKYTGWEEYRTGVMTTLLDAMSSSTFVHNDDLKVTRRGDVAWTTVTCHATAQLKAGGAMVLDGRHTAIWEKRGGRWLIVHDHLSVPLPE